MTVMDGLPVKLSPLIMAIQSDIKIWSKDREGRPNSMLISPCCQTQSNISTRLKKIHFEIQMIYLSVMLGEVLRYWEDRLTASNTNSYHIGSGLKCFIGASTSRGLMKTARSCGWPASGPMPWRGSIATRPWARCVSPGGWKWLDDRCCSANQAPGQCAQLRLDLQCTIAFCRAPSNTITLSSDRLKVSKQVRLGLFKIFFQIKCITFGEASKKIKPFLVSNVMQLVQFIYYISSHKQKKNKLILHDFCLWPPPIMVYLCNILFDLKTPYYSTHNKN